MAAPFPCPTATWRNNTYPAIDPSQAELSQAGKTIIITGAGTGIGRDTALSFAKAGAKHLVLVGRTEATLLETKALVPDKAIKISIFPASVTDEAAVKLIAAAVGQWDILTLNAGYISSPAPLTLSPLDDYWTNYEVNVKSVVIAAQAFAPTANPTNAAIYAITAGALVFPAEATAYVSGYISSKIAQARLIEYLAAENPNLFCVSVHPGMVDTAIFRASGATPDKYPMDTPALAANFLVWLSQPKTRFLNGKLVFANWDVDELCEKAKGVENTNIFTISVDGWPFAV